MANSWSLPTNRLLSVQSSEVSGSDLMQIWSQRYGGDAAITLTVFKAWLDGLGGPNVLTTQYASPAFNAFNIVIGQGNTWLILTPDMSFASGTITLPLSALLENKQEVLVNTTQQVTSLTVDGNGASAVVGAPSALGASDFFRMRYDAQSFTWYRVG